MDRGCGYWHDPLECPLCRTELPYPSCVVPRSVFSFPFTPNRLADSTIKTLIELIRKDDPQLAGGRKPSGINVGEVDTTDTMASADDDEKLLLWKGAGALHTDWERRDL